MGILTSCFANFCPPACPFGVAGRKPVGRNSPKPGIRKAVLTTGWPIGEAKFVLPRGLRFLLFSFSEAGIVKFTSVIKIFIIRPSVLPEGIFILLIPRHNQAPCRNPNVILSSDPQCGALILLPPLDPVGMFPAVPEFPLPLYRPYRDAFRHRFFI